jgi:tRNA-dihydrouridine synthase
MKIEFAPMEGVTDAVFRRLHQRFFGGVARYWMPFWSPTQDHVLTPRVRREILPEANQDVPVVPQLLTKSEQDFLWAAGELHAMGYREVNLNLGCPSGTVTAKGKGAGFLGDLPRLQRFLDEVFEKTPLEISIKTRLGIEDPAEFGPILALYDRYPIKELAVHARVLRDLYRRPARPELLRTILPVCRFPLIYNGDLKTVEDCRAFSATYPAVERVMVGRGLLADPALARRTAGGGSVTREELLEFNTALWEGYCQAFGSQRNAMLRMKEHWRYWGLLLEDGGKTAKAMRKEVSPERFYDRAVQALQVLPLRTDPAVDW